MTSPTRAAQETIEELAGVHREIQAAEGEVLLQTKDLTVKFGGLTALDSVTFDIRRGEILGMIGPTVPARPRASMPSPGSTGRAPAR